MTSLSKWLALFRVARRRGPPLRSDLIQVGRRQRIISGSQVLQVLGGLPAVEYVSFQPFHTGDLRQENVRVRYVRPAQLTEPYGQRVRMLKQAKPLLKGIQ